MSGIAGVYGDGFRFTREPVWEKDGCVLALDGRIFNQKQVESLVKYSDIPQDGFRDGELILEAYLALGFDFIPKLKGNFAFALFDSRCNQLLLARDQLGVKPLFFQEEGDSLFFGSEPKALFSNGIVPRLDEGSWGEIFSLGPARTPGKGVFAGMKELLPGHFLLVSGRQTADKAYWKLESRPHEDGYEETVEKVSTMLEDSIISQMAFDDSICCFLSGGIDSSLVSAICSRELKKAGRQLSTFSFEFAGNNENFKANDFQSSLDRPFVDLMVKHLHSNHTYLECDNQHQVDGLFDAMVTRDLPCMADVEASLLYFCSQVAKTHRVALLGECGDELFAGYPWFYKKELWDFGNFPWSHDMEARTFFLREDFLRENHIAEYALSAYEKSLADTPRLEGESAREARRREVAWLTLQWFMATLANRMDRAGAYSGLETRAPFADYQMLEYAFNIPWEMKYKNQVIKNLLVESGKGLLPDEVRFRKKSPYPKTYDKSFEGLLSERLRKVLSHKSSPLLEIVDQKKVLEFLDSPKDYGRPWYGQLMAGPQMIGYLLQVNMWMERYKLL